MDSKDEVKNGVANGDSAADAIDGNTIGAAADNKKNKKGKNKKTGAKDAGALNSGASRFAQGPIIDYTQIDNTIGDDKGPDQWASFLLQMKSKGKRQVLPTLGTTQSVAQERAARPPATQ